MNKSILFNLGLILSALIINGCGSSSGDSPGASTITGSVFASHVNGAEVTVYDTDGNIVAGPVTTDPDGSFSLKVSGRRDLIFESTGGTFNDEATSIDGVAAGTLAAYVSAGTLGSSIHLTPGSTIVKDLVVTHGKTIVEAETAFQAAFAYTPDVSVKPVDVTLANATSFTAEQQLEGLRAATFSQLSKEFGATSNPEVQFEMFIAIAEDLSDTMFDGLNGGLSVSYWNPVSMQDVDLPEDASRHFVNALLNFRADGNDLSNLSEADLGTLPFSNVAFTNVSGYRVYIEGIMTPSAGRAVFDFSVETPSGVAAPGLSVSLLPMMHMSGMKHGSPVESCAETGTPGTYSCVIYYSMGNVMMDGSSMGFWEIELTIDDVDTTYFYPTVAMDMSGDTVYSTLIADNTDMIAGMDMGHGMCCLPEYRSYQIYNDGITVDMMDGSYTLDLFIAAETMLMTKYAPLFIGTTLTNSDEVDWIVTNNGTDTITTVEVSINGTDWFTATDAGNGHWTTAGLTLMDGMPNELQVKLTVNNVVKQTAGGADYATITVTPGGGGMDM